MSVGRQWRSVEVGAAVVEGISWRPPKRRLPFVERPPDVDCQWSTILSCRDHRNDGFVGLMIAETVAMSSCSGRWCHWWRKDEEKIFGKISKLWGHRRSVKFRWWDRRCLGDGVTEMSPPLVGIRIWDFQQIDDEVSNDTSTEEREIQQRLVRQIDEI